MKVNSYSPLSSKNGKLETLFQKDKNGCTPPHPTPKTPINLNDGGTVNLFDTNLQTCTHSLIIKTYL